MAIERRGFLNGLFGGIAAGGLLLKASPADVEALAPVVNQPLIIQPQAIVAPAASGELLYNALGEAVCVVRSLSYSVDRVDVTYLGDVNKHYLPAAGSGQV